MESRGILLVEDHATTRKLVRMCLERGGYVVYEAKDGHGALAQMAAARPALVIQDLVLPDMDGFALAGQLRAIARQQPVRIVAFSGLVSNIDAQRIAGAGFDDVIPKPVETAKLLALVQRHLAHEAAPASENAAPADARDPLHAQLMQRCSALSAELTILTSLSNAVLNASDVEGALVTALSTCLDATRCGSSALYLLERHGHLRMRSLGRGVAHNAELATFCGQEAWLRAFIHRGEGALLTSDEAVDDLVREQLARVGIAHALLIPLGDRAGPLGALLISLAPDAPSREREHVRAFVEGVASQVTHALALARAFQEREIAEREAEQQRTLAREQSAMWRALVEHAPDRVMHVDFDGRLRFVNRTPEAPSPNAAPPTTWFDLVSADHHALLRGALQRVEREGARVTFETSEVDGKGSLRWTESHLGPVQVGNEITGVLVIQRDTTDKKQAEAQLIVADRLASVGALVAGVAHEINNPLSSVMANLELALSEVSTLSLPRESELYDGLSDAREAADRVRRIVQDLRIFSCADEERRGPVDLSLLLESSLRLLRSEIHYRARLFKSIGEVPPVEGNEAQLGQVLLNLVANATRSIEPGAVARNQICIDLTCTEARTVVLRICDTGCGIAPAAQARLFAPFGTAKPGTGLGLGLSLSRRIVEALGGSLTCESELGKGSVFTLSLPACDPNALARSSLQPRGAALRRGRVLVLDDEPLVTEGVRRTLTSEHDVLALDDAVEALARIRAGERFDVVLCDLIMPQMTGMDFHEALARAYPEQAARIVFVTGGGFIPQARQFLDSLPNPHLHKPLDAELLRGVVNGMVR